MSTPAGPLLRSASSWDLRGGFLERAACVSGRLQNVTKKRPSALTWTAWLCASASQATFSSTRWITPAEHVKTDIGLKMKLV